MDWLEERHREQEKKIAKLKPKKGNWAQLRSEYGDVWHEIDSVFPADKKFFGGSMMLYCHRRNEKPIEYHSSRNIRTVVKKLPKNARVIICKEGFFSERSCNLDKIPKRVWK